jgi:hypothetical protein
MKLSRYFTLAELTHSDTAARENIPNQPGGSEIESLRALCKTVLDPLRDAVGRPIKVNSGYRGPALNQRIRGSATSQHLQGMATDIQAPGTTVLDLFKLVIRLGLPFDQVIYEAQNATTKWVHLSHNPSANRGEIRVAEFGPDGRPTGYPRVTAQQALDMSERVTRSSHGAAEPGYAERDDEPTLEAAEALLAEPVAAATPRARDAQVPTMKKAAAKKATGKSAATPKKTGRGSATVAAPAAKKAPARAGVNRKTAAKSATAKKTKATSIPRKSVTAKKSPMPGAATAG